MAKNYYVGLAIFSALLIFLMIAVPQSIGLGKSGFDSQEVLTTFFFYAAPGIAFLFGILLLAFVERSIFAGDRKYGSGLGFWETGENPAIKIPLFKNPFALALLSFIFFTALGLVSFIFFDQQAFTGIGKLEQQFTQTDNLLFNLFLVVPSENLGAYFIIAFTLFSLRMLARKTSMTSQNFRLFAWFLVPLAIGLYGVINHTLRYQASDTALAVVFFFWAIGAFITVMIGNAIPFLVIHAENNFFADIKGLFSSDSITLMILLVLGILGFIYWLLFLAKKGSRRG